MCVVCEHCVFLFFQVGKSNIYHDATQELISLNILFTSVFYYSNF